MKYSFVFNGILIESIATSRAEAFTKSCETYEWLLNLQKVEFQKEEHID